MSEVRWRFATFAGYQLRYAVAGSGPAVVLPKKDRGSYVPFERLADRYPMVQIEPLGFGRSDRPDLHPPVGIHEQILEVCDQEEIGEFAVWGFSQVARWPARPLKRPPGRACSYAAGSTCCVACPTLGWPG